MKFVFQKGSAKEKKNQKTATRPQKQLLLGTYASSRSTSNEKFREISIIQHF